MAARSGNSVLEMVYWYNVAPKLGQDQETVPSNQAFGYKWRILDAVISEQEEKPKCTTLPIGTHVYTKPQNCKCFTPWREGRITGSNGTTMFEVDGIPRHVADVRVINGGNEREDSVRVATGSNNEEASRPAIRENLRRNRKPPEWFR
jgi:hypothetical protein